jgi:hypothetical protein
MLKSQWRLQLAVTAIHYESVGNRLGITTYTSHTRQNSQDPWIPQRGAKFEDKSEKSNLLSSAVEVSVEDNLNLIDNRREDSKIMKPIPHESGGRNKSKRSEK